LRTWIFSHPSSKRAVFEDRTAFFHRRSCRHTMNIKP
jgi:hypothetical protein